MVFCHAFRSKTSQHASTIVLSQFPQCVDGAAAPNRVVRIVEQTVVAARAPAVVAVAAVSAPARCASGQSQRLGSQIRSSRRSNGTCTRQCDEVGCGHGDSYPTLESALWDAQRRAQDQPVENRIESTIAFVERAKKRVAVKEQISKAEADLFLFTTELASGE